MAKGARKLIWMEMMLQELGFPAEQPINLWCDNKFVIYIANN